jgi:CBS domain-containing protein
MTDKLAAPAVYRLSIRPVDSHSGDGEVQTTLTAWCPRKGTSVEIDACATCGHCRGWVLDPSDRDSFLMCEPGDDAAGVARRDDASPEGPAVNEIMSPGARVVAPDVSVEAAMALMLEYGISGLPVIDDKQHVIGMVTKTDVVRVMQQKGEDDATERVPVRVGDVEVDMGPGFHIEQLVRATVQEIMTPLAFTVLERTPVARASALMAYEGVHRVPVTTEDGKVVGVLSSLDVLRWVAKEGGYEL